MSEVNKLPTPEQAAKLEPVTPVVVEVPKQVLIDFKAIKWLGGILGAAFIGGSTLYIAIKNKVQEVMEVSGGLKGLNQTIEKEKRLRTTYFLDIWHLNGASYKDSTLEYRPSQDELIYVVKKDSLAQ